MWPVQSSTIGRWLLATSGGAAAFAASAGVLITPVVVEVGTARRPVAVTVTNNGTQPVTYQTDTLAWSQVEGQDRYEATDELMVVPPILEVPPGGSQVLRVMLRSPAPAPAERSYRVVLEDVTEAVAPPGGPSGISFRLNHSLPVMIAPAGKVQTAVRWKPCNVEAAAATTAAQCVRMVNAGNRRVKLQSVTVEGDGWQQVLSLGNGVNVLAGAQREWAVPLASGQRGAVRSVQVKTAGGETLQAESGGF